MVVQSVLQSSLRKIRARLHWLSHAPVDRQTERHGVSVFVLAVSMALALTYVLYRIL